MPKIIHIGGQRFYNKPPFLLRAGTSIIRRDDNWNPLTTISIAQAVKIETEGGGSERFAVLTSTFNRGLSIVDFFTGATLYTTTNWALGSNTGWGDDLCSVNSSQTRKISRSFSTSSETSPSISPLFWSPSSAPAPNTSNPVNGNRWYGIVSRVTGGVGSPTAYRLAHVNIDTGIIDTSNSEFPTISGSHVSYGSSINVSPSGNAIFAQRQPFSSGAPADLVILSSSGTILSTESIWWGSSFGTLRSRWNLNSSQILINHTAVPELRLYSSSLSLIDTFYPPSGTTSAVSFDYSPDGDYIGIIWSGGGSTRVVELINISTGVVDLAFSQANADQLQFL